MPTVVDSEIRGYDAAERKVQKMARSRDNWMTPTTDANEADSRTDYGTWIQEEIEGWQSTDHFSLNYGQKIVDMARDLAERNGMDGEQWISIWEDLLTAFWCEWEEKHDTAKWWADNIQDKTIVIFRRWTGGFEHLNHKKPEYVKAGMADKIFALFPCLAGNPNGSQCMSYQHVGQHSAADYQYCIANSRPAKPAEYADLEAELKKVGYVLVVRRRATADMHDTRRCSVEE